MKIISTLIVILALTGCAEFFEAAAPHSQQSSRECVERHMGNLYDCLYAGDNKELCHMQLRHGLIYQCGLSDHQAARVVQICKDNPPE